MSGAGTLGLIQRAEDLDLAFTAMWSRSVKMECGTFFFNDDMPNDVFFDKFVGIGCLDEKTIADSLSLFERHRTVPYFYLLEREDLETVLARKGFRAFDTQHVLVKDPSKSRQEAARISKDGVRQWAETFCSAYDCMDWMGAVMNAVESTASDVEYYLDDSKSACMALYEKNSILGLYCLGTIPSMRKRGLAASLVDFAAGQAERRRLEALMLETYQRDGLVGYYKTLGFREICAKKIYTT